jgi:hypothetical protein
MGTWSFDTVDPVGVTLRRLKAEFAHDCEATKWVMLWSIFSYCLLFRDMRLMRICACAGMRYGMLAKMYMNRYGYGIKDEL